MNSNVNPKPMLAGVCSRLSNRLEFNVWALRAVLVIFLLAKTVLAVVGYGALALLFHAADRRPFRHTAPKQESRYEPQPDSHDKRIKDLDQRFREWEKSLDK